MKHRRARTVAEVIAAEATWDPRYRQRDMIAIANVIRNRARALGVTPQEVVGVTSEFNAYNNPMPAGAAKDIADAQLIFDGVMAGAIGDPTRNATFYATPRAYGNLPGGLVKQYSVPTGHDFATDPRKRAIFTSRGLREVMVPPGIPRARPTAMGPLVEGNAFTASMDDYDALAGGIGSDYADRGLAPPSPFEAKPADHIGDIIRSLEGVTAPEDEWDVIRRRTATDPPYTPPGPINRDVANVPAAVSPMNYGLFGPAGAGDLVAGPAQIEPVSPVAAPAPPIDAPASRPPVAPGMPRPRPEPPAQLPLGNMLKGALIGGAIGGIPGAIMGAGMPVVAGTVQQRGGIGGLFGGRPEGNRTAGGRRNSGGTGRASRRSETERGMPAGGFDPASRAIRPD